MDNQESSIRGIRSVERASLIMEQFLTHEKLTLKELSQLCGVNSASLSPYLKSMSNVGLIKKATHGCYELGDYCLDLGIGALEKRDTFLDVEEAITKLFDRTEHGVIVSVWGAMGPTPIRMKDNITGLYPEVRLGMISSLVNSTIGRIFSANLPENVVRNSLQQEEYRIAGKKLTGEEIERFMQEIKNSDKSLQTYYNFPTNSLSSMSVPVYELGGHIKYVLSVYQKTHILKMTEMKTQQLLKTSATELSRKLGFY
jgi:DNA-binding IclR family transcriptional regulator